MQAIRLLDVCFENDIAAYEMPAFRGAVIETAGSQPNFPARTPNAKASAWIWQAGIKTRVNETEWMRYLKS